ncbi:MAG TPA: ATP-binding protein [Planctomycetota bacterium]|nr:ATP-binding protein [Planctomycetota bacterium]
MKEIPKPLPRLLGRRAREALRRFPVVVITGARQTGKTTLVTLSPLSAGRDFRTFDDLDLLERARRQPDALLEEAPRLTLDEVQRVPELLLAIKRAVDRRRSPGRFLLTGSANLLMMRRVSESLAGRAVYLDLWPMTEAEKEGRPEAARWSALLAARNASVAREALGPGGPLADWAGRTLAGGYPEVALDRDPSARADWFDGYVRTYLERDLQDVASISALADFRRLMRLAALRIGAVLNQADLARDADLSHPTAHRYLNLLETSFQVVRVPAFARSRTKRLVKSPKLYWGDTGLAAHLAGMATPGQLESSPLAGPLFENLVLAQLLAWRETASPRPEIGFWRTVPGEEVDFVVERGSRLLPIEVKLGSRVSLSDARGLEAFLEEHPGDAPFGMLLYNGAESAFLTRRVLAAPLRSVLGVE